MEYFKSARVLRSSAICCILLLTALQGLAQTDPSSFCGPGTLWSETLQQCVPNPAIEPAAYDGNNDGCIAVNDLLGLLSVFGDCEPEGSTIYWFKNAQGWPSATGNWTNEATEFYIQDCSIDSGYFLTTDVNLAMEMVLQNGDSLEWCEDGELYPIMPIDSLEGVSQISHDDIPNGTLVAPGSNTPFYLVLPQSFEENDLLLDQSFFDSSSCGWVPPAQNRREVLIYGELYWLYHFSAYGTMNVMCGY